MRKKIIFGFLCLLSLTTIVNAEELTTSEMFVKVAPNDIVEINAIKPTNENELFLYTDVYIKNILGWNYWDGYVDSDTCNEDYSKCTLTLSDESKVVSITWKETDESVKQIVNSYAANVLAGGVKSGDISYYIIDDLELLNSNYNFGTGYGNIMNYIPSLKEVLGNSNITASLVMQAGSGSPIMGDATGGVVLSYDGIMYGTIDEGVGQISKFVFYLPESTENTDEAIIAAIKKRVDEYLGITTSEVTVSENGPLSILGDDYLANFSEYKNLSDNIYRITFNENLFVEFVVSMDDSKIKETIIHETTDIKTNISISTENTTIPLDTTIKVEEVVATSEVFTKINEVLKLEENAEVQVYDFKLFSQTASKYISKLESGDFKVSVPIKESLKDKKLVAYYVTDNNEIEEHPVIVVDGIATFTTNHFSIYTIAEKEDTTTEQQPGTPDTPSVLPEKDPEDPIEETIPPTGDKVMTYVTIGMIGLVGLGTGVILKKREN